MSKTKKITGGEEEVVKQQVKSTKQETKKLEPVRQPGIQRVLVNGEVYVLVQNLFNDLWGCAKEIKGRPYYFNQGEPLVLLKIDNSMRIK